MHGINTHSGPHTQCLRTVRTAPSHSFQQFMNLPYTTPSPGFSFVSLSLSLSLLSFILQFHYFMFYTLKIKFKSINAKTNNFTVQSGKQDKQTSLSNYEKDPHNSNHDTLFVCLFIRSVTHVTLHTSITDYNLYITTQLIIYGHPSNIIYEITQNLKTNWKWNPSLHLDICEFI